MQDEKLESVNKLVWMGWCKYCQRSTVHVIRLNGKGGGVDICKGSFYIMDGGRYFLVKNDCLGKPDGKEVLRF